MITDKDIENAVKMCKNKSTKMGVPLCKLVPYPCERVIDRGQCLVLQKLFAEERKLKGEE